MKKINLIFRDLKTSDERLAFIIDKFLKREMKISAIDSNCINSFKTQLLDWAEIQNELVNVHKALMGDEEHATKCVVEKLYLIFDKEPQKKIWEVKKSRKKYDTPDSILEKLAKADSFVKAHVPLKGKQKKLWGMLVNCVPTKEIMNNLHIKDEELLYNLKERLVKKIREEVERRGFRING